MVRISDRVAIEWVSVADMMASASPKSAIDTPSRLAVAVVTLSGDERIGLVSVESGRKSSERVPGMIREIKEYCGPNDLPYIVGG